MMNFLTCNEDVVSSILTGGSIFEKALDLAKGKRVEVNKPLNEEAYSKE